MIRSALAAALSTSPRQRDSGGGLRKFAPAVILKPLTAYCPGTSPAAIASISPSSSSAVPIFLVGNLCDLRDLCGFN
jgi:hypothetical protein